MADSERLTPVQWTVCVIAAIGFAFDIYELLMLPLIVGPALQELGGLHAGHAGVRQLVRAAVLRAGRVRRHLRTAGRLSDRPPRPAPRAHLEHSALRLLGVLRRVLDEPVDAARSSARRRSSACASSSSPRWRGWRSCSTIRVQREKVLGYTQAFSSIGGLLVAIVNGLIVRHALELAGDSHAGVSRTDVRHDRAGRSARGLAVHADERADPRDSADRDSAVPARVAEVAGEEGGGHAASGRASASCSRPSCAGRRSSPRSCSPAATAWRSARSSRCRRSCRGSTRCRRRSQPRPPASRSRQAKAIAGRTTQEIVANYTKAQETGGLFGRFALAMLVAHIASRQRLLRMFLVPGIEPFPICEETNRWGNTLAVIGRLKQGTSIQNAQAEFDVIAKQVQDAHPERNENGAVLTSLQERVSGRLRPAFLVLLGAVGCVLLIACTNLSNLLLARATGRRKEIAIRVALGAERSRLIRQMLTESVLLAGCGAAIGLPLAYIATRALSATRAISIPLLQTVSIDGTVLIFTLAAALATGVLFGIAPALQVSRWDVQEILKEASRGSSEGGRTAWVRSLLVVSEVALACTLLIGSGLLIRSFLRLLEVDPGFRPEQTSSWRIEPGGKYETGAQREALYRELTKRVAEVPGVESAGLTDALPMVEIEAGV